MIGPTALKTFHDRCLTSQDQSKLRAKLTYDIVQALVFEILQCILPFFFSR